MNRLIITLIILSFLSCNSRNSTNERKIETEEIDSTPTQAVDNSNHKLSPYDFIDIDSVKINGVLPFITIKDSLLKYLHGNPEITKEVEGCSSYGSNNDTLEYLNFTEYRIKYVCFNNKALFASMHFNECESYLLIEDYIISTNTTIESLSEKFPNSCKNSRLVKETGEVKIKFRPSKDFFYDTEFWIITLKNNKIESIEYIETC